MKGKTTLGKVAVVVNNALIQELRDQGHFLTGALERSITQAYRIVESSKQTALTGYALEYAEDLESGQHHLNQLPTVAELFKYFQLRGLNDIEAARAAVLTHKKQKEEGMPTKASSRFSKTGERKHFMSRAWKSNEQKVDSLMSLGMDNIFKDEYNIQKTETI